MCVSESLINWLVKNSHKGFSMTSLRTCFRSFHEHNLLLPIAINHQNNLNMKVSFAVGYETLTFTFWMISLISTLLHYITEKVKWLWIHFLGELKSISLCCISFKGFVKPNKLTLGICSSIIAHNCPHLFLFYSCSLSKVFTYGILLEIQIEYP